MGTSIVLLSGGIDSTVALASELEDGDTVHALTVDYGQQNRGQEIKAARKIAEHYHVAHEVVSIELNYVTARLLGNGGARTLEENREISPMYVPGRNTLFISLALAWAETLGAGRVILGANKDDTKSFPDCRPEFFRAATALAHVGTVSQPSIVAPYCLTPKYGVIRAGRALGVPFQLTFTCYLPSQDGVPCGKCDACILRREAFDAVDGLIDPVFYPVDW